MSVALLLLASGTSLATVPGQVSYQGLLLDAAGDPVTGTADLVFRLFEVETGGTSVFSESFDDVAVQDGVYEVALGSTSPLTPALLEGGALYLEVEVDGETLAPRQRLLAVPYAVRAGVAEDAEGVGGVSSVFVEQLFQHGSFDGGLPPNDDPSEGFDDVDGDGKANFIDSDNDDDGVSDVAEVAAGTDINLVNPTITGAFPDPTEATLTTTVQFQGTNFEPGMTVQVGSESPTPTNLTLTTFDVQVGPQPVATVPVTVTRLNGEGAVSTLEFDELQPNITALAPFFADANSTSPVTVQGQNLFPGIQIVFGSESPTPFNFTPSSFDVNVGPQPAGTVDVTVSYSSGLEDTEPFDFTLVSTPKKVFVSSLTYDGDLGGLTGADGECNALASAASLPGSYMAWLSDGVDDPDTRFSKIGPWARVGGFLVAVTWTDLTDGLLLKAIDETELGTTVGGFAWTNVASNGTSSGLEDCSAWTSTAGTGRVGSSATQGAQWTFSGLTRNCDQPQRLYCFEQ